MQLVDGHISRAFTSSGLALVVSSRPFMVANMPREMEEQLKGCPCVLSGQAPVKVYGTVFANDALIPSGYGDGTMCAAPDAGGMVIAMEANEAPGIKRVLAIINAGERDTLGGKSQSSSKTLSAESFSVFGCVVSGYSVFGSVDSGVSIFGSVVSGYSVFGSVGSGFSVFGSVVSGGSVFGAVGFVDSDASESAFERWNRFKNLIHEGVWEDDSTEEGPPKKAKTTDEKAAETTERSKPT